MLGGGLRGRERGPHGTKAKALCSGQHTTGPRHPGWPPEPASCSCSKVVWTLNCSPTALLHTGLSETVPSFPTDSAPCSEAVLTGESMPAEKVAHTSRPGKPLLECENLCFMVSHAGKTGGGGRGWGLGLGLTGFHRGGSNRVSQGKQDVQLSLRNAIDGAMIYTLLPTLPMRPPPLPFSSTASLLHPSTPPCSGHPCGKWCGAGPGCGHWGRHLPVIHGGVPHTAAPSKRIPARCAARKLPAHCLHGGNGATGDSCQRLADGRLVPGTAARGMILRSFRCVHVYGMGGATGRQGNRARTPSLS